MAFPLQNDASPVGILSGVSTEDFLPGLQLLRKGKSTNSKTYCAKSSLQISFFEVSLLQQAKPPLQGSSQWRTEWMSYVTLPPFVKCKPNKLAAGTCQACTAHAQLHIHLPGQIVKTNKSFCFPKFKYNTNVEYKHCDQRSPLYTKEDKRLPNGVAQASLSWVSK